VASSWSVLNLARIALHPHCPKIKELWDRRDFIKISSTGRSGQVEPSLGSGDRWVEPRPDATRYGCVRLLLVVNRDAVN
jgi:hypothetical protein